MRRSIALLPNLAGSLLTWYTPLIFVMMSSIVFVHDAIGRGWAVWLGWPIALTAAAMAGSRIRLISRSRLPGLWPEGWPTLGRTLVFFIPLACLPTWLLAPATASAGVISMGALTLALAGLAIALRFGPNGVMWLVIGLMLLGFPQRDNWVAWLLNPAVGAMVLPIVAWLAWSGWRGCMNKHGGNDLPGRLRLLFRDSPGQPLGWRLMLAYLAFGSLIIALIWLPRGYWPDLGDVESFAELAWSVTFIATVLLGITVAHELFNFRAALRFYFLLPGHDRDQLRLQASGGLCRAWLVLGVVPHAALVACAAMQATIPAMQVVLTGVVAVTVLAALAVLALRVAAMTDHAAAVLALVGMVLLVLALGAFWYMLWGQPGATWEWMKYIGLAAVTGLICWFRARTAWRRLSLERIDHWPLVKLARESSFG